MSRRRQSARLIPPNATYRPFCFHKFLGEKCQQSIDALRPRFYNDVDEEGLVVRKAALIGKQQVVMASSDRPLLDLIRRQGPMTIAGISQALGVTQTAIRNRLVRLINSGMIERQAEVGGKGRPRYFYQASTEAHKRLGQNYADLALALWDELMHTVKDSQLRRLLFGRVTDKLAEQYLSEVQGHEWQGRMIELGVILAERGIEAEVTFATAETLPILRQHSCPYHTLAETDRTVCALERKMFEKVLGQTLRLSRCRLDGHRSCDFEAEPVFGPVVVPPL